VLRDDLIGCWRGDLKLLSYRAISVKTCQRPTNPPLALSTALTRLRVTHRFGAKSHYQANRLGFVWKLASLGIPNALMYLGFTGDDGLAPQLTPFRYDQHWRDTFAAHASPILPSKSADCEFSVRGMTAYVLVRSRPVFGQSQPRIHTNTLQVEGSAVTLKNAAAEQYVHAYQEIVKISRYVTDSGHCTRRDGHAAKRWKLPSTGEALCQIESLRTILKICAPCVASWRRASGYRPTHLG
jgi:hypothetical protein